MAKHIHIHLNSVETRDASEIYYKKFVIRQTAENEFKARLGFITLTSTTVENLKKLIDKQGLNTKDASNKFITKSDIKLPIDPKLGVFSGRIINKGTVVYKVGNGYAPYFKKDYILNITSSDVVAETNDTKDADPLLDAIVKKLVSALKAIMQVHKCNLDQAVKILKESKESIAGPKAWELAINQLK